MAISFTHTFEIVYDGKTVEGKIGKREDGYSFYQINTNIPLELAETIHDLMESLHNTNINVEQIEIRVV